LQRLQTPGRKPQSPLVRREKWKWSHHIRYLFRLGSQICHDKFNAGSRHAPQIQSALSQRGEIAQAEEWNPKQIK
jgi:hypothetical protein